MGTCVLELEKLPGRMEACLESLAEFRTVECIDVLVGRGRYAIYCRIHIDRCIVMGGCVGVTAVSRAEVII